MEKVKKRNRAEEWLIGKGKERITRKNSERWNEGGKYIGMCGKY
jgi:hypothetical protein